MQALKALVVILGVLLVGGAGVVLGVILDRVNQSPLSPGRELARAVVDLPAGARVLAADADGDRLMVRIALAKGGEALILLDAKSGARLGTIELKPVGTGGSKP